ncbi:MAG: 4-hydroxy-tetrahydrodipicolinate reductase [Bacteroidales bacterium]|nr:4-hydroxy-tetrahydrodipicolinate reductase [Bacteroidales bacterium]
MRIALIGYGRMGREIERVALRQGHTITRIFDVDNIKNLNREGLSDSEVAIEFTRPDAAPANIISCFKAGIPVVSGTTGWLESMPSVQDALKRYSGTLFYASNFSIGVNLLFAVNRMVAGAMDKIEGYSPSVYEVHHTGKLDAPSGTALSLAEDIRKFTMWNGWRCLEKGVKEGIGDGVEEESVVDNRVEESGQRQDSLFKIISERRGEVTGIHEVTWVSESDTISIRHEAFSRAGFVSGALLAAEYSTNHKGLLTMQKLLGF